MNSETSKVIAEAWREMNTIRARDGVPRHSDGQQSDVSQEYWDSIMERLDAVLKVETGHGAWLHPSLFSQPEETKRNKE